MTQSKTDNFCKLDDVSLAKVSKFFSLTPIWAHSSQRTNPLSKQFTCVLCLLLTTWLLSGCQLLGIKADQLNAGPSFPKVLTTESNNAENTPSQDNDEHMPVALRLKANELQGKALYLRNKIIVLHWRSVDKPLDFFNKMSLSYHQTRAKLLVEKTLRLVTKLQSEGQTETAKAFLPVFVLLSDESDIGHLTSTPTAVAPSASLHHLSAPALAPLTQDEQLKTQLELVFHTSKPEYNLEYTTAQPQALLDPEEQIKTNQSPLTENTSTVLAETQLPSLEQIRLVIQKGDLKQLKSWIQQINTSASAPESAKIQAKALETFLENQIHFLNTQADDYYQQGQLLEAQSLWIELQKLNPSDKQLETKISRAQTVLENIQQLRQTEPTKIDYSDN